MRTLSAAVFFLACHMAAFGQTHIATGAPSRMMYAKSVTQLYNCGSGNDILGIITPGTALDVTQASTDQSRNYAVQLIGWTMEEASSVIYEAPDLRIKIATLSAPPGSCFNITGGQTDPYGNKWEQVSISGYVDKQGVVADVSTIWHQAKSLYAAKCSRCHGLHQPSEFTANQWPGILQTMDKNAGLLNDQRALIEKYLQTHARTIN